MRELNERPVCHRAEDLVSYLYGETGEVDAEDFRTHLQLCDSCRSEFSVFTQVHESIGLWRNEVLAASFKPLATIEEPIHDAGEFVHHRSRLSALAALREFFTVSPLWLRGATVFAAVLFCILGVITVSRFTRRPVAVAQNDEDKKVYSPRELQVEVGKAVQQKVRELQANNQHSPTISEEPTRRVKPLQLAINRQPKNTQARGLTRHEREQLAADLRLTSPVDEDELLAFPEQEHPNQ